MKLLLSIILLLVLNFACSKTEEKQSRVEVDKIRVEVDKIIVDENSDQQYSVNSDLRINIEEELNKPHGGDFLISLNDSILATVGLKEIYNPFLSNKAKDLRNALIHYKVVVNSDSSEFVFSNGNSIIKLRYWSTDELTAEYTELADTLLKGNIYQNSLFFPAGVEIGMDKNLFLNKFFSGTERLMGKVKQLKIWKDERGEVATIYKFQNEKLISIEFGAF